MSRESETFPVAMAAERDLDRRRFLIALGVVAAAVTGAKRLAAWVETRRPRLAPLHRGDVHGLERGQARSIAQPAGEALAVRLEEGAVVAFDRRCPHLGCPVVWAAARKRFECPCHHAAFDARTGAVLFGPPRRGLTPVPFHDPTIKETPT